MPMHEHCLLWPIDARSLILNFWSKMADRWQITFSIYITYGNHSGPRSQTWMNGFNSYWAQLWTMIGPRCTSCKISGLIQYGRHRADFDFEQGGPFRTQFSVVNDLTWTCPCMNIVCCGPLMHVASFWISGPRWLTGGKLRFPYT